MKWKPNINQIILILLLFSMGIQQCTVSRQNKKLKQLTVINQSITALNSELEQISKDSIRIVYQKEAATANPKTILKSDLYSSLDAQTQKYIKELSAVKNLIAANKTQLEKKDSIIQVLVYNQGIVRKDSTIVIKENTVLHIEGVENKLEYSADIAFNDSLEFKLNYKYLLDLEHQFIKDKKNNTVMVKYIVDDPNIVIQSGDSFYIPQQKPALKKFKKVVNIIIPSAALALGGYLGYKIGSK